MDNPDTLATLGTQDTGRRQSRYTGNIGYTKTQDEDNPDTLATLGTQDTGRRQSRYTGNIGYTRHRTKTNKAQKHNTEN